MPRTGDASILSPWGRFCQSWKSTSDAVFLDQAVLPEPNDALEARGESHLRQAFPTGVATVCALIASPATICEASPYARSCRGQAAARTAHS